MQYVRLGKTGLKVSRLALGMMSYGDKSWREWVLPEQEARPFVQHALRLGINFFDTADVYSIGASEEILGRAIKDFATREEVVIATKVHGVMGQSPNDRGLSRKHIMSSIDGSLRRLGMDYVDLYQIHRWDKESPIEETLGALDDVVRAGKARYIGASSMFAWQFAKSLCVSDLKGWTRFASMQNHYNLIYREEEREMIPLCVEEGIGIIPWSPLARGFLTGKREPRGNETTRARTDDFARGLYFREMDYTIADRVADLAKRKGVSPAQVALAWVLQKPGITAPIIGATKMYQLEEAVAALDVQLSPEDVAFLEESYQPHPVLGHS